MFNILEIGGMKKVKYMRTILASGLPLITLKKRYQNAIDKYDEQQDVINDYYDKA